MSIKKLSTQIAELSKTLAQARSDGDEELAEQLEDELYELEGQLENEIADQYAEKRDFI